MPGASAGGGLVAKSMVRPTKSKRATAEPVQGWVAKPAGHRSDEMAAENLSATEKFLPVRIESSSLGERSIRIEWLGDVRVEVPLGDVARDVAAVLQAVDQLVAARGGARRAC